MYFLGVFLFLLFTFAIAIFKGIAIPDLFRIDDLIIVIMGVTAAGIATGRIKEIFGLITSKNTNIPEKQKAELCGLINYLIIASLVSGSIGFIIDINKAMRSLGLYPEQIVQIVGYSFYPLIYSLILAFIVFMPLKFRINRHTKNYIPDSTIE